MQLQTDIEAPNSRRNKFTLKFWEKARRVDCRYWNEYRYATQRLKTQTSLLSHAELLKKFQLPLLITHCAPMQYFSTVVPVISKEQARTLTSEVELQTLSLCYYDRPPRGILLRQYLVIFPSPY
ncbi:hypothetical protein TNCV_5098441 [Trichonephila clavipes]|uniref:Uncharacterized protein n=1 Tax=Trichonephila clavipes TaxID=2585209 RepID=A0A8X6S7N3_TRICX|nr:hypothetical protein TNCV_5098441 [Trichonephila clavipes]